jgi:hypothetical protein
MDLNAQVKLHRKDLAGVGRKVAAGSGFDLQTPCAVVEGGSVEEVTLAALRLRLPCSVALASEPIERFLVLQQEHGFDGAFALCSADNDDGEAFVEAWDEAHADLARGVVVSLNDLAAMVEQARKGFAEEPRRMLVVAVEGKTVESATVATDWLLAV